MKNITIDKLYDHKRFKKSTILNYLVLVAYLPFGILCVIFRIIFLTFILLLSKLTQSKNRRLINLLLIKAFGVKACFSNLSNFDFDRNSIIVANHVVHGDFLPFLLMKRTIIVIGSGKMNSFWNFFESLVKKIVISEGLRGLRKARMEVKSVLENNEEGVSLLMFPEGTIGNGKALHKFNKFAFTFDVEIQPVYIRLNHLFPISLHPIKSSHIMNVLYSLFVPRLQYDITFISKQKKDLNEKPEDFAARVQSLIADSVEIIPSNFTIEDKNNYKKQLR